MAARCAVSLAGHPHTSAHQKARRYKTPRVIKVSSCFFGVLSAPSCLLRRVNKAGMVKYAYSNPEQRREYDETYEHRQRAAVCCKKTEPNLALFGSLVYIGRLDSVLY